MYVASQLAEFGFGNLAMVVQQHTDTPGPLEPSHRLAQLCYQAVHLTGKQIITG